MIAAAAATMSLGTVGCKGSPASPFNSLKDSPMMVYRLQNYSVQNQASTPTGTGTVPGLPIPIPEQFLPQVQQAQSMICGFLPTMPGCTGGTTNTGIATAQANAPMFEGFRIIGQAQVMDADLRKDLINVFGYEKSFQSKKSACQFPEFGIAFGNQGQSANVLVSYSCNQAWPTNFQWPHPDSGLTQSTVKELNKVFQQLFGGG